MNMKRPRTIALLVSAFLLVAAVPLSLAGATAASGATVPACGNADLKASFVATGAGMSHVFGNLRLTNVSHHACRTGGYGGLSYVGKGNGKQIGAAASREPGTRVRTLTVAPGARVVSRVSMTTTGPYDRKVCRPVGTGGFRVYVPNSYVAQFVPYHTKVCSNPSLKTLWHQAFRRP